MYVLLCTYVCVFCTLPIITHYSMQIWVYNVHVYMYSIGMISSNIIPFMDLIYFPQQFAVQLAAEVMEQYPLPEAMGTAKDIFKRLTALSNEIPENVRESYFRPILPAVVQLCRTFPPLCTEATEFLVHLSKISACLDNQASRVGPFYSRPGALHRVQSEVTSAARSSSFISSIQKTFQELVSTTVVKS